MRQDLPDLPDVLRTVRDFIDAITPVVPDKDRYHAMCCSYLLAVAEREVTGGAEASRRMAAALEALAGHTGLALDSAESLAVSLRAGALDEHWDAAFEAVLALVLARVRVSKPAHLHPMHQESVP
jgi:hypothetical protein